MTLSMTSEIKAADIIDVKNFKALKVYLLRGTDGSDLVIKTDAVGNEQIKNAGQVVKSIDPAAKMKILTASEMAQLRAYCGYVEDLDQFYTEFGKGIPSFVSPIEQQKDVVKMLKESLSFGFPFTKMLKQTIHNIEDAAIARGQGSKDLVRQFVGGLKAKGGLETLGKVVAADLFNGNSDRFSPDMNPKVEQIGPFKFNLLTIVNLGNVMMITTDNGLKATALDYVDPQSSAKSHAAPLSAAAKQSWTGSVLASKSARRKFADNIIHDLEEILNPKKSAFSLRTKLGRDASSRLDKGMAEGARQIWAALNPRPNKPAGLVDRLAIIAKV